MKKIFMVSLLVAGFLCSDLSAMSRCCKKVLKGCAEAVGTCRMSEIECRRVAENCSDRYCQSLGGACADACKEMRELCDEFMKNQTDTSKKALLEGFNKKYKVERTKSKKAGKVKDSEMNILTLLKKSVKTFYKCKNKKDKVVVSGDSAMGAYHIHAEWTCDVCLDSLEYLQKKLKKCKVGVCYSSSGSGSE